MKRSTIQKKVFYFISATILVTVTLELMAILGLIISGLYPENKSFKEIYGRLQPKKEQPINNFDTDWSNIRPHPYVGYVYSNRGNNKGFTSGLNYPYQKKSPNEFVVALFGGSLAEIFHHDPASRQLIKKLATLPYFQNRKLILINFALGAYKQPQSFFAASLYAPTIDLGITIDGFNEIVPRTKHHTRTYKPRADIPFIYPNFYEILFSTDKIAYLKMGQAFFIDNSFHSLSNKIFKSYLLNKSAMVFVAWSSLKHLAQSLKSQSKYDRQKSANSNSNSNSNRNSNLEVLPAGEQESILYRAENWARFTRQQQSILKLNGAQSVTFLQPNHHLKNSKPLHPKEKKSAYLEKAINTGYPLMKKMAEQMQKEGLYVFDLYDIYQNNNNYIFKDTCHVTPMGNKIMAQAIFEKLALIYKNTKN